MGELLDKIEIQSRLKIDRIIHYINSIISKPLNWLFYKL